MAGTFSSFSTALSALRYNRVAMDVASGNVANSGTAGYARRQVIGQTTGAPAVPAMWSRWENGMGDGVEAGQITRMVDPLLDARARLEHSTSSYLGTRAASLARFETSLGEPGKNGIAAALLDFQQGWHDVANNPGDGAARSQLIARAETLQTAIASQDRAVRTEWADQRSRLEALGAEVDQVAKELANLNQGLRNSYVGGGDAGVLLDQRDQLTLRLAELTGSTVKVNPDTTVDVTVGGQPLVTGTLAASVTVTGSADLAGAAGDPVQFLVGTTAVSLTAGEVGGTQALLGTDLPDYLASLDGFVATLAANTNAQHAAGLLANGAAGGAFFNGSTAGTLSVAVLDRPDLVAARGAGKGELDGSNATLLAGADLGGARYRELITGFGVTVSSAQRGATNQAVLVNQVDASREALSGISIDEEMVNLLAAQRGYEGASRVLTTLDSVLDTLINRTGLLR